MDNKQQTMLAKEPVGRLLFKLAIPTITAQIINLLYNMVDRMFIGHIPEYGAMALTGVGVCFPIVVLIMSFASLMAGGGAPKAAILMGRGDTDSGEKIMGSCFTGLLIIGLLLTTIFLIGGKDILMAFGASENTIGYAWDYSKIYVLGSVFMMFSLGLNAFITAQGFTKISMLSVVIGAGLNIVLDPIFIFLLNMGVQGAAIATVISQAVSAVWVLRFLTGDKTVLELRKKDFRVNWKLYLPCLALGLSPFVMQSTEAIITICFNSSLLKYGGDIAVGAMTILATVMQFSMLPLQGLTQGAQPIMSFNFGAGNRDRVKKCFKILLSVCLTYSMVIWVLCVFTPQIFTVLFTSDPVLAEYTHMALKIYMFGMGIFGIQIACQQTFVALGNAKCSLFLAILRKIILLIPLIYIVPHFVKPEDIGVFTAEPIADVIAVLTTSILFAVQFKKMLYKK